MRTSTSTPSTVRRKEMVCLRTRRVRIRGIDKTLGCPTIPLPPEGQLGRSAL
jgi:hypothetical protein